MSYSPPNSFSASTVLTSASVEGNNEALRVYLHGAIPSGDVATDDWIDTRHIQPPVFSPFEGLQHGVSGHQGGQWSQGPVVRLSFLTKYLTGNGVPFSRSWQRIPNTAFTVQLQHPASLRSGQTSRRAAGRRQQQTGRTGSDPTSARTPSKTGW